MQHFHSIIFKDLKEPTLPMQETQVLSLGQEDPLGKEMATHSSILAWEIIWTEEPTGLQSMGCKRVRHEATGLHFLISSGSGSSPLTLVQFKMTQRKGSRDASCYYYYHCC